MMKRKLVSGEVSKAILLSGAAWFTLGFSAVATAQEDTGVDPVADEVDETFTLNEIIVTARNREESLQDIPLAITAFDRTDFERRSIETLDDVARLTAGLSFEDFSGGFATPVIRGQTQTRLTALESNVSTFLDGVWIPRAWAFDVGTASLDRIEVVKGPQNARYGRNAFAGAVNYVPFKATITDQVVSGELEGTVGSDERLDGGVRANISDGKYFAVAGSFNYSTFDGTFDNTSPFADIDLEQGTTGNVGGFDKTSFSISAVVKPIEALTLEASFNQFDVENEARAGRNLSQFAGSLNCGSAVFGANLLFCGELPGPDEDAETDPRAFDTFAETDILRIGGSLELSDRVDLYYTFGHVSGDVISAGSSEVDQINCGLIPFGPPSCAFTASPIGSISYDSHELRVVYDDDDSWRFEFGGFASDGEDIFATQVSNQPILIEGVTDPATIEPITEFATTLQNDLTETEIIAVFGAFEWRSPDDRFRLGGELRYSENEISAVSLITPGSDQLSETFSFFTPRFTAEYNVTENTLAYASAARGAKAGGFNPGATLEENQAFDEETNWTFEVGAKNQFWNDRVVLNVAAFFTDWRNLQINGPDFGSTAPVPSAITSNLGGARVLGVELEGSIQIIDQFSIDGSFSFSDGQYDNGVVDQRFAQLSGFGFPPVPACDGIVCPIDGDISGNEIERTPSTQLAVGAEWGDDLPVWDGSYYIRSDFSWQNSFFASPVNLATIPDRFLLGASAGVTFGHVDASIWVRNLTDENFVSNSFVVIGAFGNSFNTFFGDRRSFGLTVKLTY